MGVLEGKRTGDSLILLSENREIGRDNLWVIRAIPVLLVFGMVYVQVMDPYSGGDVAALLIGFAIISLPFYALALWAFSSPIGREDGVTGTTDVA